MDGIVHMRLLFVVGLVVMAAGLALLAYVIEWLESRRAARGRERVSPVRTSAKDVAVGRAR
jgi:uncharacterized membrane protein